MSEEQIVRDLIDALNSFMAYDGYGQGGADDANRGDWRAAEKAVDNANAWLTSREGKVQ